ncbi:MAG: hypothetical protein SGJ20_19815 [Planctomycetota bacterium]|nr:hypothetical protein [Planctomycetota bacterium]
MFALGITLIAFASALVWASRFVSKTSHVWLWGSLAFLPMFAGIWVSRLAPYIALVGVIALALSVLRFFADREVVCLRRFSTTAFFAALLVIIVALFFRPISGDLDIEDRTDWTPPIVNTRTPQKVLAESWSTHDQNCSWPVAKLMLDLCEIAYADPVDARARIEEMGMESESINAGSMQGYVIDAGNDSIIILRGTERDEYDIIQDLRFLKVKSEQGSMHGGFVDGYRPMHSQVSKLLARYDTKRVWITGHSLGGGLAIVCAHQLLVDGTYPIAGVMTFGQPRVVQEDMKAFLEPRLDAKYVFFVNDMDPVTRVVDPYVHFGHMVRWTDSDIERSKGKPLRLLLQSTPAVANTDPESGYITSMNDRDFETYINKLEQANTPKYDKNGNLIVKGYIPNVYDHFLASYQQMLEALRTHSTK